MATVSTIAEHDVVRLVRAHQAEVWRYLRFLGASTELADDLTQETFLQLLRAPFAERGPAATSAWLRTVARNLYVRAFRRPPFELADLDAMEAAWTGFASEDAGAGALDRLRACLSRLDGRARDAIRLHYEERRSRRDVGARLGIGEDGVKSVAAMAKDGAEVPVELALKVQKLNGTLTDAVPAMLKAGLPGFGPNGAYTHPLVAANTLASTLAAAGKSLSPSQQQALEGLVRVFSAEAQAVADGQHAFKLQHLLAETQMKDRFYREVGGQLTPEQAAVMNPNGAGKYDGSSLFGAGVLTRGYSQPIAARDAGEFARAASGKIGEQLGLDEATANQVRDVIARSAAASELWQERGDSTETSLRMMRSGRTEAALRNQIQWMQQIQQQVNLTPEQRQKLANLQQVLVPLPR